MVAYSQDNGVGIMVTTNLGVYLGLNDPYLPLGPSTSGALRVSSMWIERTWALNYPTFVQDVLDATIFTGYAGNTTPYGLLSQNVYNQQGEMITITIFAPWATLPIVC